MVATWVSGTPRTVVLALAALLVVVGVLVLPASALAAPVNDNFASASTISSVSTPPDVSGNTTGATIESGEWDSSSSSSAPRTLWYTWRAPANQSTTIDTCGSAFDTALTVWTGPSYTAPLEFVTYNNDAIHDPFVPCPDVSSRVTFAATAGEIYRIQVAGMYGREGTFILRVAQESAPVGTPPNDALASAQPLSGATAYATGGNVGATRETGEPSDLSRGSSSASVWYSWTAPSTGDVTLDTCGSDFDTVVGLYKGTSYPLQLVGGNNDGGSCGAGNSRVVLGVRGGDVYRIVVAGFSGGTTLGHVQLNLAFAADPAPFDTSISGGPSGTVPAADPATFTFTSSRTPSTYECALDGAPFLACSSPRTYSGLAEGPHSFEVRAIDASGNVASPAMRTWSVATPPQTSIDSGPSGATNETDAAFAFSANEPSEFACSVDDGAFEACSSPRRYTGLSEGGHTFKVRARDTFGNTDASPATYGWTVDTTGPQTSIDSGPTGTTSGADAAFAFSASESSTFECSLDGGAFAACSSPGSYTNLSDGEHTFKVRATDAVGNTDASAATSSWSISAPAAAASSPAAGSAPAGSSNTAAGSTPAPTSPRLALTASVTVPKLKAFLAKGLKASLAASAPTTVRCTLMLDAKTAKRLKLGKRKKPVSVGTCRASLNGTTAKVVTIKVSSKASKALRKLSKVKLTLVVTGGSATATRTITILR